MRPILLLGILVFLVSACGQRGPLYLPKDKPVPPAATDTK
ncbi:MAG: hypothetical protein EPO06_00115 [Burkholderiaceae bacterium]|nr:MAG: hypothetical protein EPO06_00115 [Burkholderiaceae bacterium]